MIASQATGNVEVRPRRRPGRSLLPLMTAAALLLVGSALWLHGAAYYRLSPAQRPDAPLHAQLGSARPVGHGLGVVGGGMLVVMLLYSARKHMPLLRRWGPLRHWLNTHIFLGLMGPLLATFHTGFRIGGLVSIAYWSMVVTVLSGIFGRYVYIQLPRHANRNLREEAEQLEQQLRTLLAADPEVLQELLPPAAGLAPADTSGGRALLMLVRSDAARWAGRKRLARLLRSRSHLDRRDVAQAVGLTQRRAVLVRRLSLARALERTFHHWHVFHRPIAWVMFLVLAVHVGVTLYLGYDWLWTPTR